MEFDPHSSVVRLCLQGQHLQEAGAAEAAASLAERAWNAAGNDLERFIAAYHLARLQETAADRLSWLEAALRFARQSGGVGASTAFSTLHSSIADCQTALGHHQAAEENARQALACAQAPRDPGPFYHGTKAALRPGDLLTAGRGSNYQAGLVMKHSYFTALLSGAGLAAALAQGEGTERVYLVEPTGGFENDPNVTDKRFPGNLTRSYRSEAPLRVLAEVEDWRRRTPEELRQWRERLASGRPGDIIN